jgi:uncharacterized RDD family membrane protein YckC
MDEPHDLFAQVDDLLRCYAEALDVAAEQPQIRWVPYGDGTLRKIKVPRLRAFTGYFASVHIARSLTAARVLLVRRAVAKPDDKAQCLDRLALIDALEKALPRRPRLPLHAALLALVLGVAYLGGRVVSQHKSDVEPLRRLTGATFRLDWTGMWNAVDTASWHSLLFMALGLSIAAWLLVAGPMTSFHLKRLIFDLVPGAKDKLPTATVSAHRVAHDGIYERERKTFEPLERRRPHELRFDLIFEALLVALSVVLFVYLAKSAVKAPKHLTWHAVTKINRREMQFVLFVVLVALTGARLAVLASTARQQVVARRGERPSSVRLEVSPAGWRRRAVATCVDAVLVVALWFGVVALLAAIDPYAGTAMVIVYGFVIGPITAWTAYCSLALLLGRGRVGAQTPGKKMLGLAVVDRHGGTPHLYHLVFRELVVKSLLFGYLGALLVFPFLLDVTWPVRGGDRPALHDLVARTRVIRTIRVAAETAIVPVMSPS